MISRRAERRAHRRGRRRPGRHVLEALVALVVFVGGFEIGPTVHQLRHASLAPHTHEGSLSVAEPTTTTTTNEDEDVVARDPRPASHSHGSIAHHGVAFLHPPSPTPLVPIAGWVRRSRDGATPVFRARVHTWRRDARGPPTSA